MAALTGFGLLSLVLIPKESAPEVQVPVGIVTVTLPGAPATDMETLVTNEIERGLSGSLTNVKKITSVSREGASSVTVEFEASADIDESISDLKDRVDVIKNDLPDDANEPSVTEVDFVDQPIMNIAVSGDFSPEEFTKLANELEGQLESLAGVSRVTFSGVRDREVSILVDQAALSRFDLSLSEVIRGVQLANQTLPIGQIENDGVSYNIAFEGDIANTNEVFNIPVATRGTQPVYVRDIARVVDGLAPSASISRLSVAGQPSETSIEIAVYKQRGGDITRIAARVNDQLMSLQEANNILANAQVVTVIDAGKNIEEDLIRLSTSGLQTVVLVVIVLILAIGWREGLVAGAAIPLSFVIGFTGLYLSDNTINFVSLFALILAIGILVDSAIVMVEGINKRMKADPLGDKKQAALQTIKEFSVPLMAGTLTTVSMFSGLFLVSGVTGQFIAAIPFTINFILLASLLVALGFVPLIASLFLRRRNMTRFEELQTRKSKALEQKYRSLLDSLLGDKKKERIFMWSLRALLMLALLLPVFGVVRVIFFEQSDADYIYVEVELPEGSVKENTDIAIRRVEEVLYTQSDIESFTTTIGSGSAFGGGGQNEKLGSVLVSLSDDRSRTSTEIVDDLRAELTSIRDVSITVDQPSDGPPTGNPLGYRFLGDDLVELTYIAEQAAQILKEIPGTTNVTTSATNNGTEFVFELDKAKTAAFGLDPFTVSQIMRTAVFGTDATTITTLTDEIDVVVKLDLSGDGQAIAEETNQTSIERLENLQLKTPSGQSVLLSSIASVHLRESNAVINHDDGKRVVSLQGDVTSEGNVREINTELEKRLRDSNIIPSDVELRVGGETEESNQAFIEMFFALIVGVVLMVGVLVLQFNSFLHTRYVLSILPYSLIGIMAGLAITQLPLSFPSIMGFIALSGIVVNNSILLIDMINQKRKDDEDMPIREVVLEAATSRLRPILLTTITTVVGMIPLTYASELWSPLAYAVMFGLTFSVVITLFLIPVIYNRKPGTVN